MKKDYSKIRTYFKENINIVIPMCVTALLFDGLMCFLPIIEGYTIDTLYSNDFNTVLKYSILFISLVLFVQINRFSKRYLVRVFGNKMSLKMRSISLNNLFDKDISYFSDNKTGDILNRNLSDIYDTTEGIRKMTTEVFDTFVLLIGYLTMMFITSWKLSLISIPFFIISVLLSHYMKKLVYKYNKEYKEYLSKNKELTLSKLNNELYYRGFGCSNDYYISYSESLEILRKKTIKALIFSSCLEPLYLSISMMGLGVVTYFGGVNVMSGEFTIGVLSSFITTYSLVARKVGKVGKVFNAYQAFRISWERCKSYLISTSVEKSNIDLVNEELILDDYSVSYNNFKLPKISLNLRKGEILGVCGKIHCGKTTLLKGLSGLYEYSGTAKIGNINISDLKYYNNQIISYCSNDVKIFSDSIKNNITLSRNGNIEESLITSQLDKDLNQLGGFDKILSHSNVNISGGQQKRLQMARACYGEQFLILLDDPFQSVDRTLAINMINNLLNYNNQIIVLVSNNKDVLSKTTKILFIDENIMIGNYNELLKEEEFLKLMGE